MDDNEKYGVLVRDVVPNEELISIMNSPKLDKEKILNYVMKQSNISDKNKVRETLEKYDYDIVNTVMDLCQ